MSLPSKSTLPPSGRSMPSRQLKKVVLPAPFGPISPTASPRLDRERHVVERGDAGEALRDRPGRRAASRDHALGGSRRAPRRGPVRRPPRRDIAPIGSTVALRRSITAGSRRGWQRLLDLEDPLGMLGVGEGTEPEEDELVLGRDAERLQQLGEQRRARSPRGPRLRRSGPRGSRRCTSQNSPKNGAEVRGVVRLAVEHREQAPTESGDAGRERERDDPRSPSR